MLPEDLLAGLARLGLAPENPSDLYPFDQVNGRLALRVTFHIAGRLLEGPDLFIDQQIRNYQPYRAAPDHIDLSVATQLDVEPIPAWSPIQDRSLLQVDFRLMVPWRLTAVAPSAWIPSHSRSPKSSA